MYDEKQANEKTIRPASGEKRDVDDLIFRDEKEWLASDR